MFNRNINILYTVPVDHIYAAKCYDLHSTIFIDKDEYTGKEIEKLYINNRINLHIALLNEKPIGYIISREYKGGSNIDYLAIYKEHTGLGYGSYLLHYAIKLQENVVTLECEKRLISFYEKNGLQLANIKPNDNGHYFMSNMWLSPKRATFLRKQLYNEYNQDQKI